VNQESKIVIGEGWAALTSVILLTEQGHTVHWVSGSGAHLLPPLASMATGRGALLLEKLLNATTQEGEEKFELTRGNFLREFRNKAFRDAPWTQSPTPETRLETLQEWLWEGEVNLPPVFESRFQMSLLECFERLKQEYVKNPLVTRYEGFPMSAIHFEGEKFKVMLADGKKIEADDVIYADRLSNLRDVQGVSGVLEIERKLQPRGAIQILMQHQVAIGANVPEHFFIPLQKEADDDHVHQIWGYFTEDGRRSCWTVVLSPNETEDNHLIAKRLRRMKQTLNKTFAEGWLSEGMKEFTQNVSNEHVRMEEGVIFSTTKKPEKLQALKLTGSHKQINVLLEGFGPEYAIEQAALAVLGVDQLAEIPAEVVDGTQA